MGRRFIVILVSLVIVILPSTTISQAGAKDNLVNLRWSHDIAVDSPFSYPSASISDDGSYVAAASSTGDRSGLVYYFDKEGKQLWTFTTDRKVSALISSDGSYVAAAGFQLSEGPGKAYENGAIYFLDNYGNLLWNYTTGLEPVMSFTLSSDGSYLVANTNTDILYFDATEGELLWDYSVVDDEGGLGSVSLSSDGKVVFAGAQISGPRNPTEGWKAYSLSGSNGTLLWSYFDKETGNGDRSFISRDGKYVVAGAAKSGDDGYVYMFDNEEGKLLWKTQINSPMLNAAIASDASTIATSTNWGLVFIDARDGGKIVWNSTDIGGEGSGLTTNLVGMSADGSMILTGAILTRNDMINNILGTSVQLRDKSGQPLWDYRVEGDVSSIDMSLDGSFIAITSKGEQLLPQLGEGKVYVLESNLQSLSNSDSPDTINSFPILIGIGAAIAGVIAFLTLKKHRK